MIFAVCFTNFGPYHLARLRAPGRPPARARRPADRLRGRPATSGPIPGSAGGATSRSTGSPCSPTGPWRRSRPADCAEAMRRGARPRPARRRGDRRLRPARVDGRGPLGPAARPAGDPDVREPGDRPSPRPGGRRRSSAGGSAGSTPALVGGPSAPRLPGRPRDARGSDRPGLQRGRQRLLRATGPTLARRRPTAGTGCPSSPYFLAGQPVRPREEPAPADPGLRPLSRPSAGPDRAVGPGPLRRRPARRPRSRRPIARERPRRGDPPAGLPPGRRRCRAGTPMPSAFVHPEPVEPWGLVVNEAAACGLAAARLRAARGASRRWSPSRRAPPARRFDPLDVERADRRARLDGRPAGGRTLAMGRRAAEVVADWGPDRFARGDARGARAGRGRTATARASEDRLDACRKRG